MSRLPPPGPKPRNVITPPQTQNIRLKDAKALLEYHQVCFFPSVHALSELLAGWWVWVDCPRRTVRPLGHQRV